MRGETIGYREVEQEEEVEIEEEGRRTVNTDNKTKLQSTFGP